MYGARLNRKSGHSHADLANQYRRFAGSDELLQWDEFWRFMHDLDLGLTDDEIASMRQEVRPNKDFDAVLFGALLRCENSAP